MNSASDYHKPHAARTMASTAGPAILFPKHAESQICRVIVFAVFVSHTAMRGEARAFDRGSREVKLSAVGHTMANTTQGATNSFMVTVVGLWRCSDAIVPEPTQNQDARHRVPWSQ